MNDKLKPLLGVFLTVFVFAGLASLAFATEPARLCPDGTNLCNLESETPTSVDEGTVSANNTLLVADGNVLATSNDPDGVAPHPCVEIPWKLRDNELKRAALSAEQKELSCVFKTANPEDNSSQPVPLTELSPLCLNLSERMSQNIAQRRALYEEQARYDGCPTNGTPNEPFQKPTECITQERYAFFTELIVAGDAKIREAGYTERQVMEFVYSTEICPTPENFTAGDADKPPEPCPEVRALSDQYMYLNDLYAASPSEELKANISRTQQAYKKAISNCSGLRVQTAKRPTPQGLCSQKREFETAILYAKKLLALTDTELKERKLERSNIEESLVKVNGQYSAALKNCEENPPAASVNNCQPPAELFRQYEISMEDLVRATDNETKSAIVEKIKQINRKISEPCGQTAGSDVGLISQLYKGKLQEGSGDASDIGAQITNLKKLRGEIDGKIAALMRKRGNVTSFEIRELGASIQIGSNSLNVNGQAIENPAGKEIEAEVGDSNVYVIAGDNVTIDDGSEVKVGLEKGRNLTIDSAGLKFENRTIRILPSEIGAKVRFAPDTVTLERGAGGAVVYNARLTEKRKLFFLFPVDIDKFEKIDAQTGERAGEGATWWIFLTSR